MSRPKVLSDNEGEIRSPSGPDGKYLNRAECHWRITVPTDQVRLD